MLQFLKNRPRARATPIQQHHSDAPPLPSAPLPPRAPDPPGRPPAGDVPPMMLLPGRQKAVIMGALMISMLQKSSALGMQ